MTYATMRARTTDGGRVSVLLASAGGAHQLLSEAMPITVEVSRRMLAGWESPRLTVQGDLISLEGALAGAPLHARWTARRIAGEPVWELGLELRNTGDKPLAITRMDTLSLALADHGRAVGNDVNGSAGVWRSHAYRSGWGDEFRPTSGNTGHDLVLESRSGRSSHGMIPWLGLERGGASGLGAGSRRSALTVAPAWSGNWHIHAMAGGFISAGISPWQFTLELAPGESVTAPSVVLAVAENLDLAAAAQQRAIAADWLPRTSFTDSVPVEWNHWWPYEDQEVTEQVIAENAALAHEVGIEVATVDAGWFGTSDVTSVWSDQRGDWASVNTARFPSGLAALGESIRAAGVLPGMWIEAEAVGAHSRLRAAHPEAMAHSVEGRRHDPSYRLMTESLDRDDPTFLGYVCLGSPAGREHVLESMNALITETGARWIKLDFNIDPDAGCTRTDHGHGAGDGLFRHYEGLYAVLDAVRERHPDIMLESCSSGGLRIDLGLARHVHAFFLSDPDYTEHHLEVLAGATRLLPPIGILHWSWSQWRGDYPPSKLDWRALTVDDFDTTLRAAMLHRFGVSLRLPELRPELLERLREHVRLFQHVLAPLVRDGVLLPISPVPERGGLGERAPALQLSGTGDRHMLAAFVLDGGVRRESITARGLDRDGRYTVTDLATGAVQPATGAALLDGGASLGGASTVTSWLLLIEPAS